MAQTIDVKVETGEDEKEKALLEERIEKQVSQASMWADRGSATLMEACFRAVDVYRMAYFEKFGEYPRIGGRDISTVRTAIEKTGYAKAVPVELASGRSFARKGDSPSMEDNLKYATIYAEKSGQNISEQVAEIRALLEK